MNVVPGSIRAVTRSLGSIFFRARCFSLALGGPPSATFAVSAVRRAMASSMARWFSRNSSLLVSTTVWMVEMAWAWWGAVNVATDRLVPVGLWRTGTAGRVFRWHGIPGSVVEEWTRRACGRQRLERRARRELRIEDILAGREKEESSRSEARLVKRGSGGGNHIGDTPESQERGIGVASRLLRGFLREE